MSTLSIVIPTRNRHVYLEGIIQSFLSLDDERISMIIHDNSDFKMKLKENLEESNIKYIHTLLLEQKTKY